MTMDEQATDTPITREVLYDLVWSEPMLKVGERFGVSSSYMARVCTLLNVPRPERGYWAKLAVGRAPDKPPLPEARPGDHLTWSRNGELPLVQRALPMPPVSTPRRKFRRSEPKPTQHRLITGVKALFEAGRLSESAGYLKPAKRLLVDLAVTKTGLDKALAFANTLFLALEERGYRVVIAPTGEPSNRTEVDERENPHKHRSYNNLWRPSRCTVVYIGTVMIGLTIIEMSEEVEVRYVNGEYVRLSDYTPPKRTRHAIDRTWTTTRDFSTNRLCLQAYSPYWRAEWSQQWRETKNRDLTSRISTIIKELEQAAVEVARLVEEGERKAEVERHRWDAQHAQWLREQEEKRVAKALMDSKDELLKIIEAWAQAKQIQAFFIDAEQRLRDLPDDVRDQILDRLRRARELIGNVDALERFRSWMAPDER